mmetsp:Transcript_38545/g.75243  ORF Transcript_38545/g.75243 Transcript_38545/m.75243 type:complete len:377 (+) Transcript_38545:26-1156(+)
MIPRRKIIAAVGLFRVTVHGCSQMLPCGTVPQKIQLTNITGIVHVDLIRYGDCSPDSSPNFDLSGQSSTIEIDVESGIFRNEPFIATVVDDFGLRKEPKVDQSGYYVSYQQNTSDVVVTGNDFGSSNLTFNLPGFLAPLEKDPYNGVISFYSEAMQRLYFIYPVSVTRMSEFFLAHGRPKKVGGTAVATCSVDHNDLSCDYSDPGLDFSNIDKQMPSIVYDSMQLVSLPVVCCLCRDYSYYIINQTSVVKHIPTLNFGVREIDSRIGVAYGLGGGYNQNLSMVGESLTISSSTEPKIVIVGTETGSEMDMLTDTQAITNAKINSTDRSEQINDVDKDMAAAESNSVSSANFKTSTAWIKLLPFVFASFYLISDFFY